MKKTISVLIPAYNEQAVLAALFERLDALRHQSRATISNSFLSTTAAAMKRLKSSSGTPKLTVACHISIYHAILVKRLL